MLSSFLSTYAQTDSIRTLRDVEVDYRVPAQGLVVRPDGSVSIMPSGLARGIRILGEADAIHALAMLPGYGSGSDYGGALTIDGSDYQHTALTLDGMRVFFPYHFGGIFSDFNTAHISSVNVAATPGLSSPRTLGTELSVNTPFDIATDVGGSANVGMLSTGLSVLSPLWANASVYASARVSYIDALYGHLIDSGSNYTKYGFSDFNLTVVSKGSSCSSFNPKSDVDSLGQSSATVDPSGEQGRVDCASRFKLNVFYSQDRVRYAEGGYALGTCLRWHNMAANAQWLRSGGAVRWRQGVGVSGLWSTFDLDMPQFYMSMPSSVLQAVTDGDLRLSNSHFDLSYRLEYSRLCPQSVTSDGLISTRSAKRMSQSWLFSPAIGYMVDADDCGQVYATAIIDAYSCHGYWRFAVNPSINYVQERDPYTWHASLSTATQYMHQVGFSDIGLASNFWIPSTGDLPPQRSVGFDVGVSRPVTHGIRLSANVFAKGVWHCPEYTDNVLAVLADDYDPLSSVVAADGFNLGGNVLLAYEGSTLSANAGYSFAVCRRKFADAPHRWVPSASEPMHSLKSFARWRLSQSIDLSAHFTVSSGRRYTPVRAIFFVGGNILTEYGNRNSAHLPLYHRLDISATYTLPAFRIGGISVSSFANLSIINAYGHNNIEMQYFSYDERTHTIQLRRISSLYRFLPSISYSVSF